LLPLWDSLLGQRLQAQSQLDSLGASSELSRNKIIQIKAQYIQQQSQAKELDELLQLQAEDLLKFEQQRDGLLKQDTLEGLELLFNKSVGQKHGLLECERIHVNYLKYIQLHAEQERVYQLGQERKLRLEKNVQQLRQDYQQINQLLQEIERTQQLEQQILSLQAYRDKLIENEPCPLCGSKEHPAISEYNEVSLSDTEQRLVAQKSLLESLKDKGQIEKEAQMKAEAQSQLDIERLAHTQSLIDECEVSWLVQRVYLSNPLDLNSPHVKKMIIDESQVLSEITERYHDIEALQKSINRLRDEQNTRLSEQQSVESNLKLLDTQNAHQQELIEEITKKAIVSRNSLQAIESDLKQQIQTCYASYIGSSSLVDVPGLEIPSVQLPDITEHEIWLAQRQRDKQSYNQNQDSLETLTTECQEKQNSLAKVQLQLAYQAEQCNKHQKQLDELSESLKLQQYQRRDVYGQKNVPAERARLAVALQEQQQMNDEDQRRLTFSLQNIAGFRGQLELAEVAFSNQELNLTAANEQWSEAIKQSPFSNTDKFELALLGDAEQADLMVLKNQLDKGQALSVERLYKAEANLDALQQGEVLENRIDGGVGNSIEEEIDSIQLTLSSLNEEIDQLNQKSGEIDQKLKSNQLQRQKFDQLLTDIKGKTQQYDDWAYLNSLIGSKDGKRFRVFAQGLTLDYLIQLANQQLARLHSRYQLSRKSDDALELEVMDTWQADALRDTKTLSGGESFLVSLALALALSDLVSHKTRIDSLFLDEGFGTLDRETLDIALDALDQLNASGKMIGIISHIEALKERIPIQIEIQKMSGLGISKLDKTYAVG